jgi:hypothetical protein
MEVCGQLHALAALPPGKDPGAHWMGDWVDLGQSGHSSKDKKPFPAPARNQTLVSQPIT